MSLYTYRWVGLDVKRVLNGIPAATGPKLTINPTNPPITITIDTGGSLLSPTEEADLDEALQHEDWEFVSKV